MVAKAVVVMAVVLLCNNSTSGNKSSSSGGIGSNNCSGSGSDSGSGSGSGKGSCRNTCMLNLYDCNILQYCKSFFILTNYKAKITVLYILCILIKLSYNIFMC